MKEKLTLHSNVFLWIKKNKGLLYNSDNGRCFLFDTNAEIINICNTWLNCDNLYSVVINRSEINLETQNFVSKIIEQKFGVVNSVEAAVVSLPPILNILNDIDKLKLDTTRSEGEHILEYLSSLTIYIGGKCDVAKDYWRQTFYPYNSNEVLTSKAIIAFIYKSKSPYLQKINIVVSVVNADLFALCKYLQTIHISVDIYISDRLFAQNIDEINKLNDAKQNIVIVCEAGEIAQNILQQPNLLGFKFNFLVKSDDDYNLFETIINEYKIYNYAIIPIYYKNLQFFKNNVFLSESDILQSNLSKREVFAHQAVNTNFWGNISILPDGKVYSNLNFPPLGSINNSVYNLILEELHKNYAWRLLRTSKPCCNCLFQWLCPSPSNYEFAIGKKDLCTFNK